MESSIPPFYAGQKVVAIEDGRHGNVKKGNKYTILGVSRPCCTWLVDIGTPMPLGSNKERLYCPCQRIVPNPSLGMWPARASIFRAITEDFQAISFSEINEQVLTSVN